MRQEDLIYVIRGSQILHGVRLHEVVDEQPSEIRVNLERGTWSLNDTTRKIGEGRDPDEEWTSSEARVCGVYDRTDISHLYAMTLDAQYAAMPAERTSELE